MVDCIITFTMLALGCVLFVGWLVGALEVWFPYRREENTDGK